jgi:predicted DNA-binding transcriptional regulator YafY
LRILGTRQGITIGELAEEFNVTKRTLYQDLKTLEEASYPLLSEIVEGTYPAERRGNGKTGRFSLLPK